MAAPSQARTPCELLGRLSYGPTHTQNKTAPKGSSVLYAGGRTRTGTPVRARDFKGAWRFVLPPLVFGNKKPPDHSDGSSYFSIIQL